MFKHLQFLLILFIIFPGIYSYSQNQTLTNDYFEIEFPEIILKNVESQIEITIHDDFYQQIESDIIIIAVNDKPFEYIVNNSEINIPFTFQEEEVLIIKSEYFLFEKHVNPIPLWLSILPPLFAILIALLFKEVFTALFVGLLIGTFTIHFYQGSNIFIAFFQGIFSIADTYLVEALKDPGHLAIIIFSMLIGATVNLITRNGGMKGVVNYLSKFAKSARSGQFITWLLGILIFFDDYANTLVVGNTMRPVSDRLKISRQKLAYIVDSTAAPIAAIAFVTTWIGAELSYIQNGITNLGLNESPYSVFLNSLQYAYYPIFTLIFILFIIFQKKEFGAMYHAEKNARAQGIDSDKYEVEGFSNKLNEIEIDPNIPTRWFNAVIPILIIILGTFTGLLFTGWDAAVWDDTTISFSKKLSIVIGNSDSYQALLWSSLLGTLVAILLTVSQKLLSLKESIDSIINGFRTMLTAIMILVLAWSIALVTEHLHTADFISQIMLQIQISPYLVPTVTFILSALVAFSTGSSWGTMAILYPLFIPSSWLICQEFGFDYEQSMTIFYNVVSTVLAGSVLGDHCSPISDTTILSSLASSCNHIEHVRTQLPYALTVGTVAILFGTLPAAYGISSIFLFPAGIIVLFLLVYFFGKRLD
jgi:Na+/H+ antiporter NhaC